MKNTKYQNFDAGKTGSGRVNLADGSMEFVHKDANTDSNILPVSISHVYSSKRAVDLNADVTYGKGFKLNLQQKLTHRTGNDTKWKYIDGSGEEHKFKERYYYIDTNNKKQYVTGLRSEDIRIKPDGKLFQLDKHGSEDESVWTEVREVFAEIKTKNWLTLQTDLKNFEGHEKIETRHEELIKVDDEIKQLKTSIKQIEIERESFKTEIAAFEHFENTKANQELLNNARDLQRTYNEKADITSKGKIKAVCPSLGNEEVYMDEEGKWYRISNGSKVYLAESNGVILPDSGASFGQTCLFNGTAAGSSFTTLNLTPNIQNYSLPYTVPAGATSMIIDVNAVFSASGNGEGIIFTGLNVLSTGNKGFMDWPIHSLGITIYAEARVDKIGTLIISLRSSAPMTVYGQYHIQCDYTPVSVEGWNNEHISYISDDTSSGFGYTNDFARAFEDLDGSLARFKSIDPNDSENKKRKAILYFNARYNEICDRVNQEITNLGVLIENAGWENHKSSMQAKESILTLQEDILRINAQSDDLLLSIDELYDKYKELFQVKLDNAIETQKQLNIQIPSNYIIDNNGLIFGFNKQYEENNERKGGDLVAIFDSYDNQVSIVYEGGGYQNGTYSAGKIAKIVGSDEKEITFEYANGKLVSIADFQNRKTEFKYDANNPELLTSIVYQNGEEFILEYGTTLVNNQNAEVLNKILPPSKMGVSLEWQDGRVSKICNESRVNAITYEGAEFISETDIPRIISELNIAYQAGSIGNSATVTNPKTCTYQTYVFDSENELVSETVTVDGIVETSVVHEKGATDSLTRLCEQGVRFERTTTDSTKISYREFDELDKVVYEKTESPYDKIDNGTVNLAEALKAVAVRTFIYDNNTGRLQAEHREDKVFENNAERLEFTKLSSVNYEYNKAGKLTRRITSEGMITETVYDKKGNAVRTMSYHKSNPASKFYDEKEIAENGQILSELDERGEKTKLKYVDGTNKVCGSTDPEGNETAIGFDPNTGETASISSSTEHGEANKTEYTYTNDFLTKLTSGSTIFEYEYDGKGRKTAIFTDDKRLSYVEAYVRYSYDEDAQNGNQITTATYASGEVYETVTDKHGKVLSVNYTVNGIKYPYILNTYDGDKLSSTKDYLTDKTTYFTYDNNGKVIATSNGDINVEISTDHEGNVVNTRYVGAELSHGDYINVNGYIDGKLSEVALPYSAGHEMVSYDKLNRVCEIKGVVESKQLHYYQKGDRATNLVTSVITNSPYETTKTSYRYDKRGNITEIYEGGKLSVRYQYDALNRIIREDNAALSKSFVIDYDTNGNILSKTEYEFSLNELTGGSEVLYTYNRDELISFDGQSCVYDNLGNPTTYRSKTATWTHLRNLASLGDTQFTYGTDGLRRTKTIGENTATYLWAEGKLLAEQRTVCTSAMELPCYPYENQPNYTYATEYTIQYLYGIDGLAGFMVNRENTSARTYYYRKNLQGDITHIFDENNNLKASYAYDAWGNCKITYNEDNIANVNPFRYRGYYFDVESGLYYLKSRYYDPETGRFINADAIEILDQSKDMINGLNLYMYCGDNPVMNVDETGYGFWDWLWKAVVVVAVIVAVVALSVVTAGIGGAVAGIVTAGLVGAAAGMTGQLISDVVTSAQSGTWHMSSWESYLGAGIGGAVGGIVLATTGQVGLAFGAMSGISSLVTGVAEMATGKREVSVGSILGLAAEATIQFAIGYAGGKLLGGTKIAGLTKGTGSYFATYKAGITKMLNYGFRMSAGVALKGFAAMTVLRAGAFFMSGIFGGIKKLTAI